MSVWRELRSLTGLRDDGHWLYQHVRAMISSGFIVPWRLLGSACIIRYVLWRPYLIRYVRMEPGGIFIVGALCT